MMTNDTRPRGGIVARLGAAVLGVLAILLAGAFTLGSAVVAPLGVLAVWWMTRRRGRPMTRPGSWLGAMGASTVALLIGFTLLFASLPENTLQDAIAEAQAAPQPPPPAWVERLAPGASRPNPEVQRVMKSKPVAAYLSVMGMVLGAAILGSIAGSAGWGATLLLGYAGTGRWIGHAAKS